MNIQMKENVLYEVPPSRIKMTECDAYGTHMIHSYTVCAMLDTVVEFMLSLVCDISLL